MCEDRSCSRQAKRRYYLTKTPYSAVEALGACDVGYHMASIFELANPSALEYDPLLGDTHEGFPSGPVSINSGWVRTGTAASSVTNCSAWTSTSDLHDGTTTS